MNENMIYKKMQITKPYKFRINLNITKLYLLILFSLLCNGCKQKLIQIESLHVDFITNINNEPIFKWKSTSELLDIPESLVQIIVSDNKTDINNNKGNLWDSGKQEIGKEIGVGYKGKGLKSGSFYYVKIKVWDKKGNESNWSFPEKFFIPLQYPADWNGEWITYDYQPDEPLPVFKQILEIKNKDQIESARLYVSAPGFFEAYYNGDKIGESVLNPEQTNYEDYAYYSVYDINIDEKTTKDVLGIMLGNGWYNQNKIWGKGMAYGQPVFIAQLAVHYKNGDVKKFGTNTNWKWKYGPLTFSNIYAGETYDANLEVKDWFNDDKFGDDWNSASESMCHPDRLYEQFIEPIKKISTLKVKEIIPQNDGKYIYDFGQNFAGWVRLQIEGEKGQEITMRCVEELDENGKIDPRTTGIRATKVIQTQKYICKGEGKEVWEPKFTYFGFRYVEVSGLKNKPQKDLLKGVVVHSSLSNSGSFNSSEKNINKLHELAKWTMKSNIHGVPTDCPHREKCGWVGDAHAFVNALIYNFNSQKIITKYLFDMRSSSRRTNKELYFGTHFHDRSVIAKPKGVPTMIVPGKRTSGIASPDWGTAMVQLPWSLYLYYADKNVLEEFYPDIKVWIDYVQTKNEDGIITHGLGDWCPPGGNKNIDCPVSISSTAFHILDLKLISQIAKVLDNDYDYKYYSRLHQKTVHSFNKHFLDSINYTYGSQTANALALDIGIVPQGYNKKIAQAIVQSLNKNDNNFIKTGIFGLSRLFKVLSENGYEEEVYKLISKTGENSFAYMWDNFDATTLWEVLPIRAHDNEELYYRSHNHPMQGGYDEWFFSGLAGIKPSEEAPGFRKIIFKPYLTKQLNNSKGSYESAFGTIKSEWVNNNNSLIWNIEIPPNSTGEVFVPNYGKDVLVKVNGKEKVITNTSTNFIYAGEFSAGNYTLEIMN